MMVRATMGSPPRMRGKALLFFAASAGAGITPAYAGKREFFRLAGAYFGDHPRVCGEKPSYFLRHLREQGSPPRMRGKVVAGEVDPLDAGITPAYAGKRAWT